MEHYALSSQSDACFIQWFDSHVFFVFTVHTILYVQKKKIQYTCDIRTQTVTTLCLIPLQGGVEVGETEHMNTVKRDETKSLKGPLLRYIL